MALEWGSWRGREQHWRNWDGRKKSNKPFWEEQCRNYISVLALKTFPQAKRKNFWGCQCLVENSNSSLSTLKSHHKLSFSLSLCSQSKGLSSTERETQILPSVTNPQPWPHFITQDTSTDTSEQVRVALLSPDQNTHSPYAFCRSVGQGCDNVYGPTACSWYTCSLALRAPISFHCTGHSTLSASHNNAHYQFQDQSLLEMSCSLAARAHPSHLTDVQ